MAASSELSPTEYIGHHLSHFKIGVGPDGLWTLHADSLFISIVLGIIGLGFIWWVVRGSTAGVPTRRQAFVEIAFEIIDDTVKSMFHGGGPRNFVAPLALTVFIWVLLMNSMDFLPADLVALGTHHISEHGFRIVSTADVNTTFALALSVWLLMIFFSIKVKGFGGWLHELTCTPFGVKPIWAAPLLVVFNLIFNLVEYLSKPLSHSLRLYGNMYAGEIIFLLLWLWAATGLIGMGMGALLGAGWAIFHILIVVLQAYIFTMLTIVYIALAHEHH